MTRRKNSKATPPEERPRKATQTLREQIAKDKGSTIEAVDYTEIVFPPEKIDRARGVVAANSKDAEDAEYLLTYLGLMPDQNHWYVPESTGRKIPEHQKECNRG